MKHQKKSNIYQEFIEMCYLIAKRKFRDFLIVIYHHEPLNDDQPERYIWGALAPIFSSSIITPKQRAGNEYRF